MRSLIINSLILLTSDTYSWALGTNSEPFTQNALTPPPDFHGNRAQIHKCCSLDLSQDQATCQWLPQRKQILSSTALSLPAHLMVENTPFNFSLLVQLNKECPEAAGNMFVVNLNESSSPAALFLRNGYLKLENHYYHMDEYCINGRNGSSLELSVCPQNCTGHRPCIVKCCGPHQIYSLGLSSNQTAKKGCQILDTSYFSPLLYKNFEVASTNSDNIHPHFIEKHPLSFKHLCPDQKIAMMISQKVSQILSPESGFSSSGFLLRIREDGKLIYREPDGQCAVMDPVESNICIDGVTLGEDGNSFSYLPNEIVMFTCSVPPKDGSIDGSAVYAGLLIFSSTFLLLTIAVYFVLWDRQQIHGWTIMSHTISMFFMYIFVGTAHLLRAIEGHAILNTPLCRLVGSLSHFFFLSTFCWLSMISIDLWLTFKAILPRGIRSKGYKRYTLYSILGWGIPSVIVTVGFSFTRNYGPDGCTTTLSPGYGIHSCYLQEKAQAVYLYYPISIMMVINVFFFAVTSFNLYVYQRSTAMAAKDANQFYRLFFKLFFVMGILYLFELVSSLYSGAGAFWYWVFFDSINILRAVAIFIIFIIKPDIIIALRQRYPSLGPILNMCRRSSQRRQRHGGSSTKQNTMTIRSIDRNNVDSPPPGIGPHL